MPEHLPIEAIEATKIKRIVKTMGENIKIPMGVKWELNESENLLKPEVELLLNWSQWNSEVPWTSLHNLNNHRAANKLAIA